MAATQPIRNKKEIRALTGYYRKRGQIRNHVLIVLALHSALRIGDLLRLRWEDVYDFERQCVKSCLDLVEQKTGKSKVIALHPNVAGALTLYALSNAIEGNFLILNPRTGRAISRIQAYRIIRAASEALALIGRVSCHSLRKTFGYHAWKSGVDLVLIMEIYNHSSLAMTRRYLGITQDDQNTVYLGLALTA